MTSNGTISTWTIVIRDLQLTEHQAVLLRHRLQASIEERTGAKPPTITIRQHTYDRAINPHIPRASNNGGSA